MNLTGRPVSQKPQKPKNGTKAGWEHMNRVKQLPCVCCGKAPPSDAHHCRSGGMARDDFKTVPLCWNHHLGPEGYHTQKRTWEAKYGPDHGFLDKVSQLLDGTVERR